MTVTLETIVTTTYQVNIEGCKHCVPLYLTQSFADAPGAKWLQLRASNRCVVKMVNPNTKHLKNPSLAQSTGLAKLKELRNKAAEALDEGGCGQDVFDQPQEEDAAASCSAAT